MQQESTIPQQPVNEDDSSTSPDEQVPKRREALRGILSTVVIIIAAPLIAILLTAFVFQSYEVDGPSMEKTLQNGDRLIVLKTGKTWARITGNSFIPKRGEVIVFSRGEDVSSRSGQRQLIKRVIGLPGERVVVRDGSITIYNKENPDGFNPDESQSYSASLASTTPGNFNLTVPENEVFVCGDNRINSLDSREFGTINTDHIIGNLVLRIYPFSKLDSF